MRTKILLIALLIVAIIGCKKEDTTTTTTATTAAKSFSNVTFDSDKMFFSTSGSSNTVLDSNQAKSVAATIDITYTWDGAYDAAGFLDPITRSSSAYYWSSQFQTSWTSVSKQVIWYKTTLLNYVDGSFTAAKNDQSKIGQYFADSTKVSITTHSVWPTGTCVGGRNSTTGFGGVQIFGFKRVADGKRGLVELVSTPTSGLNSKTVVNIIIEK